MTQKEKAVAGGSLFTTFQIKEQAKRCIYSVANVTAATDEIKNAQKSALLSLPKKE